MTQAVSRQPLTAEARCRPRSANVRCLVDRVAVGQSFLRVIQLFSLSTTLIITYTLCLPERRMIEWREPSKNNAFSEIGEHWIQNNFHLVHKVLTIIKTIADIRYLH